MKTITQFLLGFFLCFASEAREITLTVNPTKTSDEVSISTNETAQVTSLYDAGAGYTTLYVVKNGITNGIPASVVRGVAGGVPVRVTVAGPATVRLNTSSETCFCTVKIEPESFPPGLTVILPEGTVGVIHVESSTNLIQWQDEWVQTFANTNQNRFFRLRAERSLP